MLMFQKKISQFEDKSVSIEKYLDLAITDGFSSPRETALTKNLGQGLQVLEFAGYQSEVLARAKKLIHIINDPLMLDDYDVAVKKEKENLEKDNIPSDIIPSKLAVFKIAFILKEFEETKPKRQEMKA